VVNHDTPVYLGIAQAATTGGIYIAGPSSANIGGLQRPPILVGDTTTPTSTPPTVGNALNTLTTPVAAQSHIPYMWLT
jgi:hypothetical protein